VTERAAYIGRIRNLARAVAQAYYESRNRLGFPILTAVEAAQRLTPEQLDKIADQARKSNVQAALLDINLPSKSGQPQQQKI
jgi:glycyl-tRNA synthetase alpha chain